MKNVKCSWSQAGKSRSFSDQRWPGVPLTAGYVFTHYCCVLTHNPFRCSDLFPRLKWGDPRLWTSRTRGSPPQYSTCRLLLVTEALQEPPPGTWVHWTYRVNLVFKPFVNTPFKRPHLHKSTAICPTSAWETLSFWYLKIILITPIKTICV